MGGVGEESVGGGGGGTEEKNEGTSKDACVTARHTEDIEIRECVADRRQNQTEAGRTHTGRERGSPFSEAPMKVRQGRVFVIFPRFFSLSFLVLAEGEVAGSTGVLVLFMYIFF